VNESSHQWKRIRSFFNPSKTFFTFNRSLLFQRLFVSAAGPAWNISTLSSGFMGPNWNVTFRCPFAVFAVSRAAW